MKKLIRVFFPLLPLASSLLAANNPAATAKPNILFILADDLGYGELSFQWPGQRQQKKKLWKFEAQQQQMAMAEPAAGPMDAGVAIGGDTSAPVAGGGKPRRHRKPYGAELCIKQAT